MKKQTIFLLTLLILLISCDQNKRSISKNLDSRFVKFEIVEFKRDSSNVYEAWQLLNSLEMVTAETRSKIVSGLDKIANHYGDKTPLQNFLIIDSLQKRLIKGFKGFEDLRFSRKEACYFVKYLIHKDGIKVPKEEYFYINPNNNEVFHRPCDWDQYLIEVGYNKLVQEAAQYSGEIMMLRYKFTGKYE